ncbi:uncharacterized protein LOC116005702 [Ipomoea triloba]|uniref:uncharacterized protein LOC116005702 n=1 Tax=Ipomoea triloba TaxID=35885 RepID=UPI00125E5D9B|nr:uncharacterized protein LOC116005702 [Ipomoea triloba]
MASEPSGENNTSQSIGSSEPSTIKRKSNDIGWEYGVLHDPSKSMDKIRCLLCKKVMSGGVYRIKEHIAGIPGNVSKCPTASKDDQIKCREALMMAKNKKKNKRVEEVNLRAEVSINAHDLESMSNPIDVDEVQQFGPLKPPRPIAPMDKFANQINPESSLSSGKGTAQQRIIQAFDKERENRVKEYVCRWAYETAIPFHAFEKDSFKLLLEAVGQYGPGFHGPNRYEMSETFLKKEVDRVKEGLKVHEAEWKLNGCSIMTDAWTDRKRRSVMNLCVNSRMGTVFISSKECSIEAHTSQFIFEYVEHGIQQVGEGNVVQIVTDNAANNMGAAKLLKEKRPLIFWTCCATHSINLMLESIAGLPRFKKVLDQAKTLTIFFYAHHKTLAMMRSFTKKRDIIRPGVTRFASAFLTLQSLLDKKIELKAMFTSNEWDECKFAKTVKGKHAFNTVLSQDKKPSMGFVYGEIMHAKEEIKRALNGVEKNYEPIIRIIEEKMKNRLDTPLHLMAYFLNPYYHYKDLLLHRDADISFGSIEFLETYYFEDLDMQNKVLKEELSKYKLKEGMFGKLIAIKGCESNDAQYDPGTPNLRTLAMKILSLTSSSSGCERNWSTFEGVS